MLHLIKGKLGARVAQLISEQFIVDRVRNDRDQQYVPLRAQIGRQPREPDQGGAADGGEHREAHVAR